MLRKLLFTVAVVLAANMLAIGQSGTLKGKILDKETKEPIPFANVVIESGGRQLSGATSDFDGYYTIKPIPPGKYDVKATFVGYKPVQISNVVISSDKITFLDINLESTMINIETFEVVDYKVPLISKDETSSGGTVTAEEIAKMPGRTASSVVTTVGGVFSKDGEQGSIRGARSEGTITYIDGVRVRGSSSIPASAIEQVSVITGGTPAQYGDATGGVVNITTKGPSREWGGGMELLTSAPFDKYGYNLLGFAVQGPLISVKDKKDTTRRNSLLGFFLAGEIKSVKDDRPSPISLWRATPETQTALEANPLRPSGLQGGSFGVFYNSEFVTKADLEKINVRDNVREKSINLTAKIDVKTTDNTNLTFGGSLDYQNYNNYIWTYQLYNSAMNPKTIYSTWRVFGRFTQKFDNASSDSKDEKKSLIQNVYYSIQADYSKYNIKFMDAELGDDLFKYGHVGKFTTHKDRFFEKRDFEGMVVNGNDTTYEHFRDVYLQTNFYDTLVSFEAGPYNPLIANYTQQLYDEFPESSYLFDNITNLQFAKGMLNGDQPDAVYGLWANPGTRHSTYYDIYANDYQLQDNVQMSFNATASADVKNHAISIGFLYEQRSDRFFGSSPILLWTLMRQYANAHIEQLDFTDWTAINDANGVFQDTITVERLYDGESQYFFDYNLRQALGLDVAGTDWVDVDSYDPSIFTLDMFNADELLNSGNQLVTYYGYDHTGKKLDHKPSFDEFFTEKDDFGNFKREIGAFEPIYLAGYITDKFAFNDLIFNIGVRIDRFDANQKVLKDQFSLFETKKAGEVSNLGIHPENIGDDYVVYVNDLNNPSAVVGYRDGATWYNAEGVEIQDPSILNTANGIAPYLLDPSDDVLGADAFTDYDPQTTIMPRIAFSFPISDEALFFAHYDVLAKRPTSGALLDPTDYFFIQQRGNAVLSNPNLKPEKTIDYELGFQQKLSNSSSLKMSAFYKEMRSMVQLLRINGAYPVGYNSWGNIDFGTVKGLTLTYDLRRTGNVWLKASYTLQFANGTGSTATSAAALISSGQPNLRTTTPLEYDRRHSIQAVVDYRYGEGKEYNGPKISKQIKGTDKVKTILLFENTGTNFTFIGGSGVPYSQQSNIVAVTGGRSPILKGMINGARLPWQFRVDARVDKDIYLKLGKAGEGKKQKDAYLNVYVQILNVLNAKNINEVYRATGNADDDGYLAAAEYQTAISAQTSEQAYRDQYLVRMQYPYNFSMPRLVRLGVSFNF
ncbi:MAG: carboxypeptidase-like regulatory domain-containing protein [Bacteroidetes bacterium]|nr:carboxypeptidase-like regulatory domain-containing protein [Bacteroidota bacterium]